MALIFGNGITLFLFRARSAKNRVEPDATLAHTFGASSDERDLCLQKYPRDNP